jgi:hypothetical protein
LLHDALAFLLVRRGALLVRRGATLAALLAAAAALPGCPSDDTEPKPPDPPGCTLEYLGDESADPVLELIALNSSAVSHPIVSGAVIDIITPPQGGRVLFVGVRATNMNPCGIQLAGALRDTDTGQVRIDNRTINLKPADDGWGVSADDNISTFANIPVCPNQWSSRDVFDQDYELEVTLTDKEGRSVTGKTMVRPACNEPDVGLTSECLCICKQGYILGEECPAPP